MGVGTEVVFVGSSMLGGETEALKGTKRSGRENVLMFWGLRGGEVVDCSSTVSSTLELAVMFWGVLGGDEERFGRASSWIREVVLVFLGVPDGEGDIGGGSSQLTAEAVLEVSEKRSAVLVVVVEYMETSASEELRVCCGLFTPIRCNCSRLQYRSQFSALATRDDLDLEQKLMLRDIPQDRQ